MKLPKLLKVLMVLWVFWYALAIVFAEPVSARQGVPGLTVGTNIFLQPLWKSGQEAQEAKKGGFKPLWCGAYFVIPEGVLFPGKGKAAEVHFESGDDPAWPDSWVMERNMFLVHIEERNSPMMKYIGPLGNDPIPYHWVLHISEKDFGEARPCVPDNFFNPYQTS